MLKQTYELEVPEDWTDEQIEAHLNPKADTSVQDGLKALSEVLGEAFKTVEVKGIEIPQTKLDGVEKSLKSIESAIKAIKTPELPDNKEVAQALKLVVIAIGEFKAAIPKPIKIPEPVKPKGMKIIRKPDIIDGHEVQLLDSVEYVY